MAGSAKPSRFAQLSRAAVRHCGRPAHSGWKGQETRRSRWMSSFAVARDSETALQAQTALAAGGGGGGGVDEDRLALRLRLGDGWRDILSNDAKSVVSASRALVDSGRFEENGAQSAAADALDQLPGALKKAREARMRWDKEQLRRTKDAESAAHRTRDSRKQAAEWQPGSWLNRKPDPPSAPAVVGPACWLALGPPPAMRPAGCYLHGSVGSGKSTLMDLFCLFGRSEYRIRRQHFHEFSLWLHQTLHKLGGGARSGSRRSHILQRVCDIAADGTDVICLDEFAITNVADAAIFGELLKLFAERNVAIVLTTNRQPEDLYSEGLHRERYVPQLVERIRGDFLVVPIQGADYREALLQAEAVARSEAYTSPADSAASAAASDQATASLFFVGGCAEAALRRALAEGGGGCVQEPAFIPGEIKVSWGRSLPVPGGMSAGFVRFHFDDLCRKPLSAEDYLHIAVQCHTVFVHNVPRLSIEEHNEARRFTNFVDALYEHSVRLICHSEVPIAEVLRSVEVLHNTSGDAGDAARLGVFDRMYDDSPNFQIQIKEVGSREKWQKLQDKRMAEEQQHEAMRLQKLANTDAVEGDIGSGWSAAPATADLSSPDQGVAGVMVAAVGSLQESGFAARRALSRLKEMRTSVYLESARKRRESFVVV